MMQAQRDINRKLRVISYAQHIGNVSKACRYFGVGRLSIYEWKKAYADKGESGRINSQSCPRNPTLRTPPVIEEKVLHLRRTYHLGLTRISRYLERNHRIKISFSCVYLILIRQGMNRLPKNTKKRTLLTHCYEKQVPGHHIQVDVKFLKYEAPDKKKVRRFQDTAIDDATRVRALKIYRKDSQINIIQFIDCMHSKYHFRIHTVRANNGHDLQAKFHWHLTDLGIRHVYIKPRTARHNGKVERSRRIDETEYRQQLSCKGDLVLDRKLTQREYIYNLHWPQGSLNGATPYEILYARLSA